MKWLRARQRGATIIEFALVLLIFLMFLFGILDFARMLFTWSAAAEASRVGARYAITCMNTTDGTDAVKKLMQGLVPQIANVQVEWEPAECTSETCENVKVRITDLKYHWIAPIPGPAYVADILMPEFVTVLPRESMAQDTNSAHSKLCNTSSYIMKIALISPNPEHLADMVRVLENASHTVVAVEGGKSRLREVAQTHRPELVLIDGICRDISELTLIAQTTGEDPSLAVVLLCSSHTPDFLLEAMRAGVREVLPSPPTPEALLAAVDRLDGKRRQEIAKADARVLAFMACKGGSGATFLATNLGWELAESHKVLLIDLNLQFGDALAFLHDGKARSSIAEVAREIRRLDAALLTSSTVKIGTNYHLLPAPEDLRDAADIRPEVISAIFTVAAAQYDFIVIDLPRNLDALCIAALDRAWRIYPVLQANLPDIRHSGRLLTTFRSLGYADEKVEFILNRYQKGQDLGLPELKRALGAMKVQTVPNDWHDVQTSIATGAPLVRSSRDSGVARHLFELANSISPRPEVPPRGGIFDKLFRKA